MFQKINEEAGNPGMGLSGAPVTANRTEDDPMRKLHTVGLPSGDLQAVVGAAATVVATKGGAETIT